MRVGVDLTSWSNRRGYGRFTRGLVRAVLEVDREHEYVLFVDAQTAERGGLPEAETVVAATRVEPGRAAAAMGRRSLRDLWAMRRAVARVPLDVFFFPTVYTYFPIRTRARVIVGIHDVIAEEFPDAIFPDAGGRRLWRLKSRLARRRADWVMTVSEHARRGLVRVFDLAPERIAVVGESADPVFRPLPKGALDRDLLARHSLSADEPALAYVGGMNPHKNLPMLVGSLAELRRGTGLERLKLILVGDVSGDHFTPGLDALRRSIAEHRLDDAVIFTGYLEDAEVRHLLAYARALVLPSLAEGYGLPAVEAAACGTPVVATLNSPLPELLEGGGLFVDPSDAGGWTEALGRILGDANLRSRLGATARARASRLDWRLSAGQFRELLAAVSEGGR